MFTGIVQAISPVLFAQEHKGEWKIQIQRPNLFSNVKIGDSVAVDGVCLTVESLTDKSLGFHLSFETLNLTGWDRQSIKGQVMNLEQALKWGDSIGGHFVTGHVDGMAKVILVTTKGDSRHIEVQVPAEFQKFFWKKAFISLNGVSLTIHEVKENNLSLCLVPETLKRTNLKSLKVGTTVTFEVDSQARPKPA